MKAWPVLLLAAVTVACSEPSAVPDAATTRAATGSPSGLTLAGRVVLEGEAPPAGPIRLDADPQCRTLAEGETRYDESLVMGDGNGVRNVFVYVQQGLSEKYAPPAAAVVLDQQKCRYVPRVLGIQAGQTLTIRNSDPLLHTVRADASENARFNVATPVQGVEVSRTFVTPEVMVPIKCDMHPWMHAYVGVLDHPFFAVTDDDGGFVIAGLPAGTYTIGVWHERLGVQSHEVTLQPGQTVNPTFVYQLPKAQ